MSGLLASDTTDLVSAWSDVFSAAGTVVAAVAAATAAVIAIRTLLASKRDSRDRSRPMVGADLVPDPHPSARTAFLVVRNFGPSVAYNVKVAFDPPLVEKPTRSGQPSVLPFIIKRYAEPIPTLIPGNELSNIYFIGERDPDNPEDLLRNDEPIPDRVTVTITYGSAHDLTEEYSDTFVLDMRVLLLETFSEHSDSQHGLQKRSTKALEKITPAITALAKDIGLIEEYIKPAEVREREEAQRQQSAQRLDDLRRRLHPERYPAADDQAPSATESATNG